MVAIYGEGHGRNQEAWDTLYEAIQVMNEVVQEYKEKYKLNYSVLATPAEGLSGRFTRMDRKRYGIIPGVNDLDYYVNSFHVDVREEIGMHDKIRREAPFHAITLGGHISYIELDGEAKVAGGDGVGSRDGPVHRGPQAQEGRGRRRDDGQGRPHAGSSKM